MLTRFYVGWQASRALAVAMSVLFAILVTVSLNAWDDHPDKEDHSETDRLFALIQKQTGAEAYERMILEQESEKALLTYKDSKFKKKVSDESSD